MDLSQYSLKQLDTAFAVLPRGNAARDEFAAEIEKRVADGESDDDEEDNGRKPEPDQLSKALMTLGVLNEDDFLQKGGEGSRGGQIIGHTSSGKPIYSKGAKNKMYANFTADDHFDAADVHDNLSKKYPNDNSHAKRRDQHVFQGESAS